MIALTIRERARNINRLIAGGGRDRFGNRLHVQKIDRISSFIRGIFSKTPFELPSGNNPSPRPRFESVVASASGRTLRLPEDTVQGCRDRSTADLLKAVTVVTANQRRRLELSAESWTGRANLLGRLNKSFEKRDALDRAHKQYEIDRVRL